MAERDLFLARLQIALAEEHSLSDALARVRGEEAIPSSEDGHERSGREEGQPTVLLDAEQTAQFEGLGQDGEQKGDGDAE